MSRSGATLQRLSDMGIEVWQLRRTQAAADSVAVPASRAEAAGPAAADMAPPRLRMASGSGDWLLVQDQPWAGHHDQLLNDIQATLGSQRCRFAQWADSDSAGVAIDELGQRGIRHLLVFGKLPAGRPQAHVHIAPSLDELATHAEARRALWQLLAPLLDEPSGA